MFTVVNINILHCKMKHKLLILLLPKIYLRLKTKKKHSWKVSKDGWICSGYCNNLPWTMTLWPSFTYVYVTWMISLNVLCHLFDTQPNFRMCHCSLTFFLFCWGGVRLLNFSNNELFQLYKKWKKQHHDMIFSIQVLKNINFYFSVRYDSEDYVFLLITEKRKGFFFIFHKKILSFMKIFKHVRCLLYVFYKSLKRIVKLYIIAW